MHKKQNCFEIIGFWGPHIFGFAKLARVPQNIGPEGPRPSSGLVDYTYNVPETT